VNEIDWGDRAFYDDGEWVLWSEMDADSLRDQEWCARYPNANRAMMPYFDDLLGLAKDYHQETGLHLAVYGDLGELFGAITHGIKLNKNYAQGADGRIGNDHVEVKTITPFKNKDVVVVDKSGHFNKLFVVKINESFEVSGRMIDRKQLPKRSGRYLKVRWADLPDAKNKAWVSYERVSDLLCMSNSVHASLTKEHEDNDDYEGSIR